MLGIKTPFLWENKMPMAHNKLCTRRSEQRPAKLSLLVAALAAQGALAQSTPEIRKAEDTVVTATRVEQSSFDVPASIDAVSVEQIQSQTATVNLSEPLARIPGVQVLNRQNYAQDLQISSRGFGTRSTFGVRGVRLIADDIPATMPDGQGQAATIDLGSAKRVEVLRGPFSALYGNSSGGVIQAFTEDGPDDPTLGVNFMAGSFGMSKYGFKFAGDNNDFNYVLNFSHFETNGFRDFSAAERDHFNSKFAIRLNESTSVRIIANALRQPDSQDPLGLTRAQFEQDPEQATLAEQFQTVKDVDHRQLGLVLDHNFSPSNGVKLVTYAGTREVYQPLAIPAGPQNAATHSGGVVDLDRNFSGLGVRFTHRHALAEKRSFNVVAGIDYDRMKERRQGFKNFLDSAPAVFGVQGTLKRNEDNTVSSFDQYIQGEFEPLEKLRVFAGLRHSKVRFKSEDFFIVPSTANGDESGSKDYSTTNPIFGVLYRVTPTLNAYFNYGKGFETPTFAEIAYRLDPATGTFAPGLNFDLKPMKSDNYEVGVKSLLGEATKLTAAAFFIKTKDEIVPLLNQGGRTIFQNATRSERKGLEVGIETEFREGLSGYLALTYLDAEFTKDFTSRTVTPTSTTVRNVPSGNKLPATPEVAVYGEIAWKKPAWSGFSTALEMRHNGKVYVDDVNSDSADSYTIFNLRAGLEQKLGQWRFKEFARVDNLADEDYASSVIVNEANGRFFEPAPSRNWLLGVNVSRSF